MRPDRQITEVDRATGTCGDYPLITIGITSYNAADTIGRAIMGALKQDWPNRELIIVDDGSQDSSVSVIQSMLKEIDDARLIEHDKNRGFPAALNTILKNAHGNFIAIFDDDDVSRSIRLSEQYRTITDYERKTGAALIACYGSGVRHYPNGYTVRLRAIGSQPIPPTGMMAADYVLFFRRRKGVFYGNGVPSFSLMARKETFETVGPYDEEMARSEDSDFAIRLGMHGGHFIGCSSAVVDQYSTGGTDKRPIVNYRSQVALIEKYREYLEEQGSYIFALQWQRLRYFHFSGKRVHALSCLLRLSLSHPIWTWSQFFYSAPRRFVHGTRMRIKFRRKGQWDSPHQAGGSH